MSRHALTLPLRTITPATRQLTPQWICRRCLATQADVAISSQIETAPSKYNKNLPSSKPSAPDGKHKLSDHVERILKQPLNQRLPPQYLQHSTVKILPKSETVMRQEQVKHKRLVGVVVNSGKMDKTVTVRINGEKWNKRIHKMFPSHEQYLVHDPNNSLVTGDVVELHRLKVSRRVEHVVASIVSPFGTPIETRPPIPSADERLAAYKEYRFKKLHRRELRARAANGDAAAVKESKKLGLDPGKEAVAAVEQKGQASKSAAASAEVVVSGDRSQKPRSESRPKRESKSGSGDSRTETQKADKRRSKAED